MENYITDPSLVKGILNQLSSYPTIGLDTETKLTEGAPLCSYNYKKVKGKMTVMAVDPHTAEIRLLQLSSPTDAYAFDINTCPLELFREFLEGDREFSGQNLCFDVKMLRKYGICPKRLFDTMIATQIVEAGLPMGDYKLGSIAERVAGITMDKTEQSSDWSPELTTSQVLYALNDVVVLHPIVDILKEVLIEEGLMDVMNLEMALLPVIAKMEYDGVLIDIEHSNRILKEISIELEEQEEICLDLAGNPDLNIRSVRQVLATLASFDIYPISPKTKKPCTELDVLKRIDHPFIDALLAYRKVQKLVSTYLSKFPSLVHPITGRVHCSYTQTFTDTGRISARSPSLQNVPRRSSLGKRIRQCFTAPPGQMMIVADYSMIEVRVMGLISRDKSLCDAIRAGEDIHSVVTRQMFPELAHLDKGDPKFDDARDVGKTVVFATGYGVKADNLYHKFRKILRSKSRAQEVMDHFHNGYPDLMTMFHGFHRSALNFPYETRTLLGRRRSYDPASPSWKIENQAGNQPIQGTAGDIMKAAMIECYRAGLDIVLNVHDEIMLYCAPKDAEEHSRLLEQCMITGYLKVVLYGGAGVEQDIPCVVDAKAALNWDSCKSKS